MGEMATTRSPHGDCRTSPQSESNYDKEPKPDQGSEHNQSSPFGLVVSLGERSERDPCRRVVFTDANPAP